MPELPEVETIRRDLQKFLTHKIIQEVKVWDPTALTGISPNGKPFRKITVAQFKENVIGKEIRDFFRKGKYLIMEFRNGDALMIHLRMTGQLLIQEPTGRERVIFFFNQGKPLCFIDRRRFGEIVYSINWKEESAIRNLGVEPLNGAFSASFLKQAFRHLKCAVHSALLNQKIVSGLGNIYATEALFEAGIKPTRSAGRISLAQLEKLAQAIRKVLRKAILRRGYSLATYVDVLGKKGRSQLFSMAYGKEGMPCPRCKSLMMRTVLSSRGVVYCPTCQK